MTNAVRPAASQAPSQAAIGRALGLSKASITKLKYAGMPVSSIEAARAWRDVNLCFDGRRTEISLGRPQADPRPTELVERATALVPMAIEALKADRFELVEPALRLALQQVPDSHFCRVKMPFEVWDALTADVRRVLDEMAAEDGFQPGDRSDTKAEVELVDKILMAAARGWVRIIDKSAPAA